MNKILFVAMDGTICEFHDYKENRILMDDFEPGFFLNKKPLKSILYVIENEYKDYIKIALSSSPSDNADIEKEQWLKNQGLNWLHIFLRYQSNDKSAAVFNFIKLNNIEPSNITIIDNDLKVLRACEKMGVTCIHPSHLLVKYEEQHD